LFTSKKNPEPREEIAREDTLAREYYGEVLKLEAVIAQTLRVYAPETYAQYFDEGDGPEYFLLGLGGHPPRDYSVSKYIVDLKAYLKNQQELDDAVERNRRLFPVPDFGDGEPF